jgi:multidrug efflux pump subunit AcrA (membrane-fusion protein)
MSSEGHQDSAKPGHTANELATPAPPAISKRRVVVLLFCALVLAVILAVIGILPRIHAEKTLAQDTNEMAIPQVLVIEPKAGAPTQEIVLPGNIQAFEDAPIYSRTDGYLKKWYIDIGGRVKKGQLLAEIESPEVDQQLMQGRADLSTAQSNLQLSQTTSSRYADLLSSDAVSQQDTDNAVSDMKAKQTMVKSAQANVSRLEQLQSFEKITAPFDGVITARNTDVGQLINAGNASTGSNTGVGNSAAGTSTVNMRELFHIAAINTLRVFINVPQIYSTVAKPSTVADLTLDQFPGRKFSGKLVRNANAIDLATRTLLVEVDVKNNTGELLPGSYAEVHLRLNSSTPTLLLPVSALVFRTAGLQVATLGDGNRAHLSNITLGRDFGTQVEVVSGLTANEKVIDSPPDSLVEGEQVRVVAPQTQSNSKPATGQAE